MAEMTGVQVIKKFFGGVREVTMQEFKDLNSDERRELADGAAANMGLKRIEKTDPKTSLKSYTYGN